MSDEQQPVPTTQPLAHDPWICRLVIAFLGSVTLVCVVGGIVVSAYGSEVPGAIISIGSGAGGALAALLSKLH